MMSTSEMFKQVFCPCLIRPAKVLGRKGGAANRRMKEASCSHWLSDLEGFDVKRDIKKFYDLEKSTGHGATSVVFMCTNKKTGEKYAAKRVDKKKMIAMYAHQDGAIASRMLAEIEISLKLKHKNLIELVDVFETTRYVWVVMECMHGGELFDFIINNQGMIKESDAIVIMHQLVTVMAHIHNQNIVHRDLKPENIMLKKHVDITSKTEKPFIKVIDFGMSKMLAPGSTAVSCLGTPGYIAPEVLARKEYTQAVDMYAVGVIAYIILCGYMPMKATDDDGEEAVIFPEEEWSMISDDAKDFISSTIVVNPKKRLSSVESLSHPWLAAAIKKSMLKKRNSILCSGANLAKPLSRNDLRMRRASALGKMSPEEKAEYDEMVETMRKLREEQKSRAELEANA